MIFGLGGRSVGVLVEQAAQDWFAVQDPRAGRSCDRPPSIGRRSRLSDDMPSAAEVTEAAQAWRAAFTTFPADRRTTEEAIRRRVEGAIVAVVTAAEGRTEVRGVLRAGSAHEGEEPSA